MTTDNEAYDLWAEAEAVAGRLREQADAERARIARDAGVEALRIRQQVEADCARLVADAEERIQELITSAGAQISEVLEKFQTDRERRRDDAQLAGELVGSAIAQLRAEAEAERERILAETRQTADHMRAEAEAERERILAETRQTAGALNGSHDPHGPDTSRVLDPRPPEPSAERQGQEPTSDPEHAQREEALSEAATDHQKAQRLPRSWWRFVRD